MWVCSDDRSTKHCMRIHNHQTLNTNLVTVHITLTQLWSSVRALLRHTPNYDVHDIPLSSLSVRALSFLRLTAIWNKKNHAFQTLCSCIQHALQSFKMSLKYGTLHQKVSTTTRCRLLANDISLRFKERIIDDRHGECWHILSPYTTLTIVLWRLPNWKPWFFVRTVENRIWGFFGATWAVLTKAISGRSFRGETDDSRKVRIAHVCETSIELRESSPILRESSDDPKSTW